MCHYNRQISGPSCPGATRLHSTVTQCMGLTLALCGTAGELQKICCSESWSHSIQPHRVQWSTGFPTSHSLQKPRMEASSVNSELSSQSSCEIAGNVCSQAVPYAGYLEPSRLMWLRSEAPAPMPGIPRGTQRKKCAWILFCFRRTQECVFYPHRFPPVLKFFQHNSFLPQLFQIIAWEVVQAQCTSGSI